jgi:hypothetical protein
LFRWWIWECVCVCVRMCTYIYIYIYIYTHTHTHTYIYIYTHIIYIYICTHTYIQFRTDDGGEFDDKITHIGIYTCPEPGEVNVCMHVCMRVHKCTCQIIRIAIYRCAYTYVRMYMQEVESMDCITCIAGVLMPIQMSWNRGVVYIVFNSMYLCLELWEHACIHTYACMHTYIHTCVRDGDVYTNMCTHESINIYIYIYIYTYVHTHIHTYKISARLWAPARQLFRHTCINTYIHTYIHISAWLWAPRKTAFQAFCGLERWVHVYTDMCTHA